MNEQGEYIMNKTLNLLAIAGILTFGLMAQAKNHVVRVKDFRFAPAEISVAMGDSILFINQDRAPHSVVPAPDSPNQFTSSVVLRTGDEFSLSVDNLKDIAAKCGVHPSMPGITVNVQSKVNALLFDLDKNVQALNQELASE